MTVVASLRVALATMVSRRRECLKKLLWVPPKDAYWCFLQRPYYNLTTFKIIAEEATGID